MKKLRIHKKKKNLDFIKNYKNFNFLRSTNQEIIINFNKKTYD